MAFDKMIETAAKAPRRFGLAPKSAEMFPSDSVRVKLGRIIYSVCLFKTVFGPNFKVFPSLSVWYHLQEVLFGLNVHTLLLNVCHILLVTKEHT